MLYYSTNDPKHTATLEQAVMRGLAPDGGLYMPQIVAKLPPAFLNNMAGMSLAEIGFAVANFAFQGDIEADALHDIIFSVFTPNDFPITLIRIDGNRFVLELFHGPTMAFKDVGALFMGQLLRHFRQTNPDWKDVHVLVATSGDTGAAVANGMLGVPGVRVTVLYPQDTLSYAQEAQFASLGQNVTALEVEGSYDDCKNLVNEALLDAELNKKMRMTTATTVNVARLVSQTIYYFYAYAQLCARGSQEPPVIAVPSANLGNLASGILARKMGLPVKRFVSVENQNNIFYNYIATGQWQPRPSVASVAPALDAGNPTNFPRLTDMLGGLDEIRQVVHAYSYDDDAIVDTMREVWEKHHYQFDPHSAIAWRGLNDDLAGGEVGISLATAHPAKFRGIVEDKMGRNIDLPARLARHFNGTRRVNTISNGYGSLRRLLLSGL